MYISKGKERMHNCKPFLVNALRKGGQEPIIRHWIEQILLEHLAFSTGIFTSAGVNQRTQP